MSFLTSLSGDASVTFGESHPRTLPFSEIDAGLPYPNQPLMNADSTAHHSHT